MVKACPNSRILRLTYSATCMVKLCLLSYTRYWDHVFIVFHNAG